jgi:methionyl-tRNA formyltransferase
MNKKEIRIIFMGTPEFAVASLKALNENGFNVVAVITSMDKPAGRGQKIQESEVKKYALSRGLIIMQPENLKNEAFLEELKTLKPDLQVVVAFRMLPESVWSLPKYGTINLHASLLPQYRGAAPINHVIMNGETKTGLTTFFIEKEIDTGNIILQQELDIDPEETAGELHDKMMLSGGKMLIDTINSVLEGNINIISQSRLINKNEPIKTANKIFKENCIIRWCDTVENIYNFIRGLSPTPTAWTILKEGTGKEIILKIFRTQKITESHSIKPGTIVSDHKGFFKIAASNGYIDIKELQPEGKKRMKTSEWLNGYKITGAHIKDLSF